MGVLVKGANPQITEGVGPHQYGAGRCSGAHDEINLVRAAARIWPQRALATLDIRNAFGSVHWDHALKVALVHAPRLAPALATIWAGGATMVYAQSAECVWTGFAIRGSLIQGCVEAHPLFCLVIGEALARVAPCGTMREQRGWKYWLYVDDIVLQVDCASLATIFATLLRYLALIGLDLQPSKCAVHVPAAAGGEPPP
jgi:hypothetical protein